MKLPKSLYLAILIAGLLLAPSSSSARANGAAQKEKEKMAHTQLKVGDVAPDFTLLDNQWKPVKLSDFRGKKNVILAFYVLAFTGG
jgi:cytochrome oxidase Cu insertion factor (SCO1/SenC/PrrC family)